MRKWSIIGILVLNLPFLWGFQGKIYDFSLEDVDRRLRHFNELRGEKLTVIDFWATWCQPCTRSLPKMAELSGEFRDRGVAFIGISIDSPRNQSKIKPFSRSMGIDYPVLKDPGAELMGELDVLAVPALLIVDRDMKVLYVHEGFHAGDEDLIREEIEKNLSPVKE